jgi:hypothetical protein
VTVDVEDILNHRGEEDERVDSRKKKGKKRNEA